MEENETLFFRLVAEKEQLQQDICNEQGHDPLTYQGKRVCQICGAFEGAVQDLSAREDMFSRGGNVFIEGILVRPQPEVIFVTKEDKARETLVKAVHDFGVNPCPCGKHPGNNIDNWIWVGRMFYGAIMCRKCGTVFVPLRDYTIHNFINKDKPADEIEETVIEIMCPECNEIVKDIDTACPTCGVDFSDEPDIVTVCPDCQNEVDEKDELCGKCGASLMQDDA